MIVTNPVRWKVCGMRDEDNILRVSAMQPDYLGFIFYEKSPRFVGHDFKMPSRLGKNIKKAGVFVNASTPEILKQVEKHELDIIQLHGNEPETQLKDLKKEGLCIFKVFSVGDDFDFQVTKPYQEFSNYFLFDTKGKYYGGNAVRFNWEILSEYDQQVPFILSGGIDPENMREIQNLTGFNLHGIDINSGVEISPALKDIEKVGRVKEFIHDLNAHNKRMI